MFDSLVGRDKDNRIVPQLAGSWRLLDDGTCQCRLRRGVVFRYTTRERVTWDAPGGPVDAPP
jgi:ABC-type transport system substrate-binding protein